MLPRLLPLLAVLAGCHQDAAWLPPPETCDAPARTAWVADAMSQVYLWADRMPDLEPGAYEDPASLVEAARVDEDRWSTVVDRDRFEARLAREDPGFGLRIGDGTLGGAPIQEVYPGSPAAEAELLRGERVFWVDATDVRTLSAAEIEALLYDADGEVTLEVLGTGQRTVVLESAPVSVPLVEWDIRDLDNVRVGRVFLRGMNEATMAELEDAFADFQAAGVSRLILDLRYAGGGTMEAAAQLVDLVIGGFAEGYVSWRLRYNPHLAELDEERRTQRLDASISATRVVFIAGPGTISASEQAMVAIRPWTDSWIVGRPTGGKPVGARAYALCEDEVFLPILFQASSADGQTGYFDGVEPDCPASDDLAHAVDDPEEDSLAAALHVISEGACP